MARRPGTMGVLDWIDCNQLKDTKMETNVCIPVVST